MANHEWAWPTFSGDLGDHLTEVGGPWGPPNEVHKVTECDVPT